MRSLDKITTYLSNLWISNYINKISRNCVLIKNSSDVELRMKCKQFSEHNPLLEEALYELNKAGLLTYACCKGHIQKQHGYIAFKVEEKEEELVNHLCNRLLEETKCTIYIHCYRAIFEGTSVGIYFPLLERQKALTVLTESLKEKCFSKNPILTELFSFCRLEKNIHSDLMYGISLTSFEDGYTLEAGDNFMFQSATGMISASQLEQIVKVLHSFSKTIHHHSFSKEQTLQLMIGLNREIGRILKDKKLLETNSYDTYTQEELITFLSDYSLHFGSIFELLKGYQENTLDEKEEQCMAYFIAHEKEYIQILKVEESLQKREKICSDILY